MKKILLAIFTCCLVMGTPLKAAEASQELCSTHKPYSVQIIMYDHEGTEVHNQEHLTCNIRELEETILQELKSEDSNAKIWRKATNIKSYRDGKPNLIEITLGSPSHCGWQERLFVLEQWRGAFLVGMDKPQDLTQCDVWKAGTLHVWSTDETLADDATMADLIQLLKNQTGQQVNDLYYPCSGQLFPEMKLYDIFGDGGYGAVIHDKSPKFYSVQVTVFNHRGIEIYNNLHLTPYPGSPIREVLEHLQSQQMDAKIWIKYCQVNIDSETKTGIQEITLGNPDHYGWQAQLFVKEGNNQALLIGHDKEIGLGHRHIINETLPRDATIADLIPLLEGKTGRVAIEFFRGMPGIHPLNVHKKLHDIFGNEGYGEIIAVTFETPQEVPQENRHALDAWCNLL